MTAMSWCLLLYVPRAFLLFPFLLVLRFFLDFPELAFADLLLALVLALRFFFTTPRAPDKSSF